MNDEQKYFIIGFVKGYKSSNLQNFNRHDGKYLLTKIKNVNYEKIEYLAELNAIRSLMYNREYHGENFTLGEILDVLGKTNEEGVKIREDLTKLPSWTS